MREPYESVIFTRNDQFRKLGLEFVSNEEFQIVYSGSVQVSLITERYYHPSLSVAITDSANVKRELGLLENVVDKPLSERHKAALTNLTVKHQFQNTDLKLLVADGSFRRYVELILDQAIEFLEVFRLNSFSLSSDEEVRYSDRDRKALRRFGIF